MLREESLFVAPAYFWVSPEDLYGMYCEETGLGTVYSPTAQTQVFQRSHSYIYIQYMFIRFASIFRVQNSGITVVIILYISIFIGWF